MIIALIMHWNEKPDALYSQKKELVRKKYSAALLYNPSAEYIGLRYYFTSSVSMFQGNCRL